LSGRAPRIWPGATVAIAASGPSLSVAQLNHIRGRANLVVINSTFRAAPWANVLYACDGRWWTQNTDAVAFTGLRFALQPASNRSATALVRGGIDGLETDPRKLATGGNSGHQAINLAVHLGARRIVLVGYDMRIIDGKAHHHPDHVAPSRNPPAENLARWAKRFETMVDPLRRLSVEVINATPGSAIECFPRARLEDVL
jgi:hypothetical protein